MKPYLLEPGYKWMDVAVEVVKLCKSVNPLVIAPWKPTEDEVNSFKLKCGGRGVVSTLAKIAYDRVGKGRVILDSLPPPLVKKHLDLKGWEQTSDVLSVLNLFVSSSATDFYIRSGAMHIGTNKSKSINPNLYSKIKSYDGLNQTYNKDVVSKAAKLWRDIKDGLLPVSFEIMMKLYQLTADKFHQHDLIIVLNAEDSKSVLLYTCLSADNINTILLGDPNQALHTTEFKFDFRQLDYDILSRCKNDLNVNFMPYFDSIRRKLGADSQLRYGSEDQAYVVSGNMVPQGTPRHYVTMSNIKAIEIALDLSKKGVPYKFLGGIDRYGIPLMLDLAFLKIGQIKFIKNKYVERDYGDFKGFEDYVSSIQDPELVRIHSFITSRKNPVSDLQLIISDNEKGSRGKKGSTIGTIHRSKLHYFDIVDLSDEFCLSSEPTEFELKSLYSAFSMTKKIVITPVGFSL
ncbi:hypothetical protein ACEUAI_18655 [Aeromonas veronii]